MPVIVTLPPVNDTTTDVTIGAWLCRVGDRVTEGEPLVEIVSDKVTIEVPAPATGTLATITVQEGETVPTGAAIATIALAGDDVSPSAPATEPSAIVLAPTSPPLSEPQPVTAQLPVLSGVSVFRDMSSDGPRRLITPRAATLSREHGLAASDLATMPGSGLGGRLDTADVLAFTQSRPPGVTRPTAGVAVVTPPVPTSVPAPGAAAPPALTLPTPVSLDSPLLPLTPVRRAIASHMERSVAVAPHGWMSVEIDMSAVTRARTALRSAFEPAEGFNLTYVPFFATAVVHALQAMPALNQTWADGELQAHHSVNLAVAVAIEGGLVVPVIGGADGLNLTGLARALQDRIDRARTGRLTPADMTGGTCTINNTGAVGSVLSRPIINQPQVAIVTMEAITRRPVVVGDEDAIAVRPMMHACLSYDERAVDAGHAGRFLAAVRDRLAGWS